MHQGFLGTSASLHMHAITQAPSCPGLLAPVLAVLLLPRNNTRCGDWPGGVLVEPEHSMQVQVAG